VVSYAAQKYDAALGFLTKAVQTNPEASGAGVRTAVALCCFKLEQYDRARLALEKSLALDVST
jgi:tetratricopeptide (TPR) repeat protein